MRSRPLRSRKASRCASSEDDFNPLAEAILFRDDAGGVDRRSLQRRLVSRSGSGGLRVVAESPGRSLLYLPFQFSHCLRLEAEEGDGGVPASYA